MKEWNRARGILIVLSLAVAGAGFFALVRSALLEEAARDRVADERARLMARNEASLKRVEELERVYREEILPMRNQLIRNRQQFVDALTALSTGGRETPADRPTGGVPPGPDWARVREVLDEVLQDPGFASRPEFPGGKGGNGHVH